MSNVVATAPAERPAPAQFEHEGFTVRSNEGTAEDIQRDLGVDAPDPASHRDTDAADAAGADPDSSDEPKLKANDVHKRIAKTTYEREEANRKAEEASRRADELAAENARLKAERERPRDEPRRTDDEQKQYENWKAGNDPKDPKPSVGDFEDHDAYLDARDAWNERRFERRSARAQQERQQVERFERMQEATIAFRGRLDAEKAKDPEFAKVIDRIRVPEGPITDVFLVSPVAVEMARYLDANPKIYESLVSTPSRGAQLAEIKRIEGFVQAQLELGKTAAPSGSAPAPKTTKAHPPINPVVGSHVAASDDEPGDDASDAEWFAWHERQGRKKS